MVDVTPLVDILGNRGQRLYRVTPVASDVPERSVMRIGPTADETGATWAAKWPRPSRLLVNPGADRCNCSAPRPATRRFHLARKAPAGETGRRTRAYLSEGGGFDRENTTPFGTISSSRTRPANATWVYRAGDGVDTDTGSHLWFLHGVFG